MAVKAQTVVDWLEQFAPKHLAVDGDPIGLQIGSLEREVHKVMITLDVTQEVVEEAVRLGVQLIIAHHPALYHPLKSLNTNRPKGRLVAQLIKHDITVYAAHTNLDTAEGGLNDWLAERLGLKDCEALLVTQQEILKKLVVFVPKEFEEPLRLALGEAGAGHIGLYSHCTFRSEGIGTFKPEQGANPFIGQTGAIEQVEEVKLETVFPAHLEKKIINTMLQVHPYEEVAYDIYTLDQKGKKYGLGRIGYLERPMTLEDFSLYVKSSLDVPFCRVAGPKEAKVHKVAVLGGDGNKFVQHALLKGADVFVTGDLYYHTVQDALEAGLSFVDPGHHAEKIMMEGVQRVLIEKARQNKLELEIIISQVDTNPFHVV
jgi:dinuclear metal center YbgI/SA1388 family protein